MKAISAIALAALLAMPIAAAEDKPSVSPGQRGLWAMLCTQDGVARGYKNKELEQFVGRCLKAKQSGGDKNDSTPVPEMANC